MFKQIFLKLFCLHDWKVVAVVHYKDCDRYLLKCVKCGKLSKKLI